MGPFILTQLNSSVFIWFQGSEWNAANFEELQKNKSVFSSATLCIALCILVFVVHLYFPLSHEMGTTQLVIVFYWVTTVALSLCLHVFQCGLYSECDEGDWQLFPRVLHLYEHQSVRCGSHRPAPSLDRHIQLHQHCKVVLKLQKHQKTPNLWKATADYGCRQAHCYHIYCSSWPEAQSGGEMFVTLNPLLLNGDLRQQSMVTSCIVTPISADFLQFSQSKSLVFWEIHLFAFLRRAGWEDGDHFHSPPNMKMDTQDG